MQGTNWDYDSNARGRFDALIVGSDDAADTVSAVIAQAGGRVLPGVSWDGALERLQTLSAVPVVVLDARGVAEDALAAMLPAIDHEAAGRGLPLVIGTDMARIDVIAASLQPVHRGRGGADDGAALDRSHDRRRDFPAGARPVRSPPRFHVPDAARAGGHAPLYRVTPRNGSATGLTIGLVPRANRATPPLLPRGGA